MSGTIVSDAGSMHANLNKIFSKVSQIIQTESNRVMKTKENHQQGHCVDKAPNSQSYKTRSEWKLVLRRLHILKLRPPPQKITLTICVTSNHIAHCTSQHVLQ